MSRKNRAFTLIELLIVTSILFVISLGIYATFNNGIKIWYRLNGDTPEEDLYIMFDKFRSDVRDCLRFKNINFYGREDLVSFAAIVDGQGMSQSSVGSVTYTYDVRSGAVLREEKDFSHVYTDDSGVTRKVARNVKSLKFQYYSYDAVRKEYVWQDEWQEEGLPLAVWLEVEFIQGDEVLKATKTVNIPIAG